MYFAGRSHCEIIFSELRESDQQTRIQPWQHSKVMALHANQWTTN
jgi:hypothetical protein